MGKTTDFRNLNDYKLALRVVRQFAPARFAVAKGYDLRKIKNDGDLTRYQKQSIRDYYRFLRPLVVYGYRRRYVKNRVRLAQEYGALYGVKPLPGISRVPMPVDKNDFPEPVKFTPTESGQLVATVTVAPGVRVSRLSWGEMGYTFADLVGDRLFETMREIWRHYKPDAVGIQAGHSRVKREGMIRTQNHPDDVVFLIQRLQNRYNSDAGNHFWQNWQDGLELYYFGGRENKKGYNQYLKDEQERYKNRAKIGKSLKNIRHRLKILEGQRDTILKVIATVADSKDGKKAIQSATRSIKNSALKQIDTKIKAIIKKRDELTKRLFITQEF